MNKSELISEVASKTAMPKKDAEKAVNAFIDTVRSSGTQSSQRQESSHRRNHQNQEGYCSCFQGWQSFQRRRQQIILHDCPMPIGIGLVFVWNREGRHHHV